MSIQSSFDVMLEPVIPVHCHMSLHLAQGDQVMDGQISAAGQLQYGLMHFYMVHGMCPVSGETTYVSFLLREVHKKMGLARPTSTSSWEWLLQRGKVAVARELCCSE